MENSLYHILHNLLIIFITVAASLTGLRAVLHHRYVLAASLFLLLAIPLARLHIIGGWVAQVMVNLAVFGIFYKINWFLTNTADRPEHNEHLDKTK